MEFFKFIIRWVGSNLAVPFWVVGHIHLSINIYEDIYEILTSFGMNIIVIWAMWLDWKESKEKKIPNKHESPED
jgi:hypothetical protein